MHSHLITLKLRHCRRKISLQSKQHKTQCLVLLASVVRDLSGAAGADGRAIIMFGEQDCRI